MPAQEPEPEPEPETEPEPEPEAREIPAEILPPGWHSTTNINGVTVYVNHDLRRAQYELPQLESEPELELEHEPEPEQEGGQISDDVLPTGWHRTYTSAGRAVYINHELQRTQFERPEPEPVPAVLR